MSHPNAEKLSKAPFLYSSPVLPPNVNILFWKIQLDIGMDSFVEEYLIVLFHYLI